MGKLAKYAALAGVGKGVQEYAENKREERLSEVEYMRQRRIAEWQSAQQDKRQKSQQEFTLDLTDKQNEFSLQEAQTGREFTSEENQLGREFTSKENQLDRESREKIAGINAMGRSGNVPDWVKQRFERTKQSVKNQYGETVDEVMAVFDKKSGVSYVLKDGVFQAPNSEVKIPPSQISGEVMKEFYKDVQENPAAMYGFLEEFGWLPIWTFDTMGSSTISVKRSSGLSEPTPASKVESVPNTSISPEPIPTSDPKVESVPNTSISPEPIPTSDPKVESVPNTSISPEPIPTPESTSVDIDNVSSQLINDLDTINKKINSISIPSSSRKNSYMGDAYSIGDKRFNTKEYLEKQNLKKQADSIKQKIKEVERLEYMLKSLDRRQAVSPRKKQLILNIAGKYGIKLDNTAMLALAQR